MTSEGNVFPAGQHIAEFVHGLRLEHAPVAVRQQVISTLIDFFRVGIVGAGMEWTAKHSKALSELGGAPLCSVLFSERRTDPVRAAYTNGVIAGSLDWDDTHVGAMLHPGVAVWPAALAVAEMTRASGRLVAEAIIAGYETDIALGLSVQPDHFHRGFQATATCGTFGAAVAAAKLFGLDVAGIRNALGIAASYASGVAQFYRSGSDVKRLHAGKAAAAGVEAALLARAGLTGPHDAIEGVQGFAGAFTETFDSTPLTQVGTVYRMLELTFKPHAGSARLQAAVEAACELARDGLNVAQITEVEIGIPAVIQGRLTLNEPASLQEAQVSVPFAAAMALALTPGRRWPPTLTVDDFARSVKDESIRSLAKRTRCVVDDEIERATTSEYVPARVTVALRNGSRLERKVMLPAGSPRRPMSSEEIGTRFRDVAASARIPAGTIDAWLSKARALEALTGIADLMTLRLHTERKP